MPRMRESARKPLQGAPFLATRPLAAQARGRPAGSSKTAQNQLSAAVPPSAASIAGRSGSHFVAERLERRDPADHDLEFGHFARLVEFDEVDVPLELPFADIGGKFRRGASGACDKAAIGLFSARAVMEALSVRTGLR